ncbi:hypothetical protein PV327_009499 [Microctonus hyperodae]|uniref:YEATS domain-containing protein n=1 Tax=Microctonus hyperodae TaxID=165561 RepID=A0AA39FUL6_MICHY|nr:hypothetical protein PV327_009499 [Microctonus hyperodae]
MNTCKDLVEEQDPDYAAPGPSNNIQQQKLYEKTARTNTSRKITAIIEKEFTREIDDKKNEILLIQNRLNQALKILHLLRYVTITDFYNKKQCIPQSQHGTNEYRQTRIHPAVKQVIGQSPTYLNMLSKCSGNNQQNSTALTTLFCQATADKINDNETEEHSQSSSNDSNSKKRSLDKCENNFDNEPLKKIPRYIPPKYNGPERQIPSRGHWHKTNKTIVVGNISKCIPSDEQDDNASHKWTVYVRGMKEEGQIEDFVSKIRFFLHPSYRPNDVIEVTSPPFHLTRRGWGEFPLRIQLHFKDSINKPSNIIYHLKLDRSYTGLQILGPESIYNVPFETQKKIEESQEKIADSVDTKNCNSSCKLNEQENNVTIVEHSNYDENNKLLLNNNYNIFMDHDYISFYQPKLNNIKKEYNDNDEENNSHITAVNNTYNKIAVKKEHEQCNNLHANDNCNTLKPLEIIIPPRFPSSNMQKTHIKTLPKSPVKQMTLLKKNHVIPGNLTTNAGVSSNNNVAYRSGGTSLLKFKYNPARSLLLETNSNIPALKIARPPIKSNEANHPKAKITVGKDKMKITTKREYYEDILKSIDDVKLTDVESLMRFIIKRIPIISENASDPEYRKIHPYICPSEKEFLNCNIGKQRALEWYRAKAVHSFLKKKCLSNDQLWTIREIIVWCRLHGYTPSITSFHTTAMPTSDADTKNTSKSSKVSATKTSNDISGTLSFNTNTAPESFISWQKTVPQISSESYQADELIDVVGVDQDDITKKNFANQFSNTGEMNKNNLQIIPVPKVILPLHTFVCNTSRLIGIRIEPEELAPGVSLYAAGSLIVKSVECLLEDLLRSSLAKAWERNKSNSSCPDTITLEDVRGALLDRDEFSIFTNYGLMNGFSNHQENLEDN